MQKQKQKKNKPKIVSKTLRNLFKFKRQKIQRNSMQTKYLKKYINNHDKKPKTNNNNTTTNTNT